ncbi:Uncharacterised protein [Corynebacterium kutscheri]|uniref:N-acetyltransferase domain-containing protein n=2 Tax=Corynebacterium kutscheri TaxID=35755 RepID=A0A0F6TF08_9CORY|nr:hypothetical protein [Corynebacterium kutscheri]AKE42286.1 hypothetical protein UL82_10760 [Corynebacterium kutscheri]VEH05606.1 Uncharacterised protein [Corynebacterium kutscheri]VEH10630.1 Uncharacterised protein [Corynebacterium kutscheri]VEH81500.1 Uncharacterised protein [Corynebacterium kutscheri]
MLSAVSAIRMQSLSQVHPQCAKNIFFELAPKTADRVKKSGDPRFEKEAWFSTVLTEQPSCGFNIGSEKYSVASLLFCAPQHAPGVQRIPTAPASQDAYLITSMHIDPGFAGMGLETVLFDAAIREIQMYGATAIEAFGFHSDFRDDATDPQPVKVMDIFQAHQEIGLMSVEVLTSAGFQIVQEHPVLPRLRLELPPPQALISAMAVNELLAKVLV